MADDVTITVGAAIDKLVEAVGQANEHIASIGETINGVTESASHLLEIFGLAFGAKQIVDFVASMGEAGEQIERTSAMLGISTTATQQLGFIAKATGGDAQGLALSMERLQVNLQQAQNSTSRQALALHALGLSAKELIGLPLDEQMNRIADAVSKFADGGNKTAIVIELMGRSGAQMIPVLDKGRAGLDELRQTSLNAATVMTGETVEALAQLEKHGVTLRSSLTALGGTLVGLASSQLSSFSDELTTTASHMTALASTGMLNDYVATALSDSYAILAARIDKAKTAIADFFVPAKQFEADMAAADAVIAGLATKEVADLDGMIDKAVAGYKKLITAMGEASGGAGKPQAPAIPVTDTSALKASNELYEGQIKAAENAYKQIQQQLEAEVKLHQVTYDQETQALLAALDTRWQAELNAYEKELALYPQGSADWQRAWNERAQAYQRFVTEHEAQTNKMLEQDAKQWESMLKPIESAFNSQLRGLLAGTESWGQAMKKMTGDVLIKFIEMAEEMGVKWIATEAAKTAATMAGVTARTAAENTGAAASLSTQFAAAMESIAIDLGKVFASLAAWLTANFGPAGVPMAVAATAGVGALAVAEMKKFDVGAWEIPGTMPGLLHPGEMVVPAGPAAQLRSALSGEGSAGSGSTFAPQFHFNGPVIGSQAWINQMIPQITRAMDGYRNLNPNGGQ